eukprot:scpid82984/ scgid14634/ 
MSRTHCDKAFLAHSLFYNWAKFNITVLVLRTDLSNQNRGQQCKQLVWSCVPTILSGISCVCCFQERNSVTGAVEYYHCCLDPDQGIFFGSIKTSHILVGDCDCLNLKTSALGQSSSSNTGPGWKH